MYGNYRDRLISNGYLPVPLYGRGTAVKGFTEDNYVPPQGFSNCNIGILCGTGDIPVCGIDIDIDDPQISDEVKKLFFQEIGITPYRIGQHPRKMLVYRTEKGMRKKLGTKYDKGRVEVQGKGQHFTSHGLHPSGRAYIWPSQDIITIESKYLPFATESQIQDLLHQIDQIFTDHGCKIVESVSNIGSSDYDPDDPLDEKRPLDLSESEIKEYLKGMNPDCSRAQWINVGLALHHQTNGEGFILWDEWSAQSGKYNPEEMEGQWGSFGKFKGEPLTFRYIIKHSKKENDIIVQDNPSHIYIPTLYNCPERPEPLLELHDRRILSRGSMSLLSAPAGQGKTQVISAICAAIAEPFSTDIDTLGFTSYALRCMYIDTEQTRYEHHITWLRYLKRIRVDDDPGDRVKFRLISEISDMSVRQKFLIETIVQANPPSIILLDGIGDFVKDVNDASECVPFIYKIMALLKRQNIALLTTLHVNPTANSEKMRGVLGSELWRKAEFSAIIQRIDKEVRVLTTDYALGKNRSDYDRLSTFFKWSPDLEMMVSCEGPEIEKKDPEDVRKVIVRMLSIAEDKSILQTDIIDLVPATKAVILRTIARLYNDNIVDICKKNKQVVISIKSTDLKII